MKFAIRFCASILAVIMLTGCVAQQIETTINADGSGTMVSRGGFTKQAAQQLESMGESGGGSTGSPADSLREQAAGFPAEWDAKVEDWETDKFTGAEVTMKFADLAMLNEQLSTMFADSSSSSPPLFGNTKVTEEGDNFVIETDVALDTAELDQMGGAAMFADAEVYWEVTVPGSVVSAEPADKLVVDGSSVKINVPLTQASNFHVKIVGSKSGGALGGLSLPLILGIVGGLVVVLGLVFFFMQRRKAAPAAAGAYAQQPGSYDAYGQQQQGGYGQQPGSYDAYGQQQQGGYQQPGSYDAYGQQQQGGYSPPSQPSQPSYTPPAQPGQPSYSPPSQPSQPSYTPPAQPEDPNKTTRFSADDVNKTTRFSEDDVNKTTRFPDDPNKTTRF